VTTDRPLFRPEAVEYHARGRGADDVQLDLTARGLAWWFRALAGLLVAAVLVVFGVHVNETTRGPVVVGPDGRAVTVVVPVGALARLRLGQPVRYAGHTGQLASVGAPFAENGIARVPVTAVFDQRVAATRDDAVVVLGRRSLFDVIRRRDG
jgi:hypothetical protein